MPKPSDDRALTTEAPALVSCDHCGQTIGVYEPLIKFEAGQAWETSRADEIGLPLTARYFHRGCYQTL